MKNLILLLGCALILGCRAEPYSYDTPHPECDGEMASCMPAPQVRDLGPLGFAVEQARLPAELHYETFDQSIDFVTVEIDLSARKAVFKTMNYDLLPDSSKRCRVVKDLTTAETDEVGESLSQVRRCEFVYPEGAACPMIGFWNPGPFWLKGGQQSFEVSEPFSSCTVKFVSRCSSVPLREAAEIVRKTLSNSDTIECGN